MALKFGIISEIIPAKALVRVEFPEDGIVSFPLPVLVNGSNDHKFFHSFSINEHVVCLMDERLEHGVCLGAIYNEKNLPPSGLTKDKFGVNFGDGAKVEYNTSNSEIKVEIGTTKIIASPVGIEISKGTENLKTILTDLLTAISIQTHTTVAVGSPTTPPINAADFIALITRVQTLLS